GDARTAPMVAFGYRGVSPRRPDPHWIQSDGPHGFRSAARRALWLWKISLLLRRNRRLRLSRQFLPRALFHRSERSDSRPCGPASRGHHKARRILHARIALAPCQLDRISVRARLCDERNRQLRALGWAGG